MWQAKGTFFKLNVSDKSGKNWKLKCEFSVFTGNLTDFEHEKYLKMAKINGMWLKSAKEIRF